MSRVRRPLGGLATAGERLDHSGTTTPTNAARNPAVQSGLSRIRDYQFSVTQIRRGVIFLIAFTGLMGTACLSGIPSITCYALADAYTTTLGLLAALFLIAFITIIFLIDVERRVKDANIHTINTIGSRVSMVLAGLLSCVLVFAMIKTTTNTVDNIKTANAHCLEDTLQQKHNPNDKMPLLRGIFSGKAT
jgi:hypothetical protein